MRVGTELKLTVWPLLGLQLATALAAIVLLGRMSPAIQNILEENVASLKAVEQMQRAVAAAQDDDPDRRATAVFEEALRRAEQNVTEAEERPVLRRIRDRHLEALAQPGAARQELLGDLALLARINHRSMDRADVDAKRLGERGAWAIAILGMSCLVLGIWAIRRTARTITYPLCAAYEALMAFRRRDPWRRALVREAAAEVVAITATINELLDVAEAASRRAVGGDASEQERVALAALLDARAHPTLLVSDEGEIVSGSVTGLRMLAERQGLREALREQLAAATRETAPATEAGAVDERLAIQRLGPSVWLVELDQPAAPAESAADLPGV